MTTRTLSPLTQSFLFHGLIGTTFVLVSLFNKTSIKVKPPVRVEIKEVITAKELPAEKPLAVNTAPKPKVISPTAKEPKKIFGINKNTLTDEGAQNGVAIKSGNTIAKDIDQTPMNPEDAAALPIPTDEYLISRMPKLKAEIRIPYPPEARKNNIEGLVVLEILIDAQGKVRSATLIEGPGYGLNEAALKAIYAFEFTPALVDEKPVPVKIRYGYRFVLN